MEIANKEKIKLEIKNKIDKYIKIFPFYFYMNIIINLILIATIVTSTVLIAIVSSSLSSTNGFEFLLIAIIVASIILKTTIKGFFKNIRVLYQIQAGDYEFGIGDHELDNMIEFIEDLPLSQEEVTRMEKALSFNKIIDVLEAVGIIVLERGHWNIDLVFKYQIEALMEKSFEGTKK